jgi:lysylphosphatidylglycerol synthetase-like protein (DUF2156 family)
LFALAVDVSSIARFVSGNVVISVVAFALFVAAEMIDKQFQIPAPVLGTVTVDVGFVLNVFGTTLGVFAIVSTYVVGGRRSHRHWRQFQPGRG